MDVTGHRNVQSLASYEGDDENQSRQLSNIISGVHTTAQRNPLQALQPSTISCGVLNAIAIPFQPFQPPSSNLSTVQNTFTGTVNICGGYPGVSGNVHIDDDDESTAQQKKFFKRVKIFDDSDSD